MKRDVKNYIIWGFLTVMGMIFLIVGIIICVSTFSGAGKIETTGTITEVRSYRKRNREIQYETYVSYYVDGRKYESKLNGGSSSYYAGKEIDIYYDEDEPSKIGQKSLDILLLLFPVTGMILTVIGGTGLVLVVKRKKKDNYLKENGELIYADYVETIINTSYTVNGRHPYNIICTWKNPRDNKVYTFKSKNIWENPKYSIENKNLKLIPVYINPDNIKKYVIDIDSVME